MKLKYTTPDMEIVRFECEDVITTSGFTLNDYAENELRLLNSDFIKSIDPNQWS